MTAPVNNAQLQPGLYIVATPIGNLGDLSRRASDILANADVIAVEDSRVTAKLLHHIGVKRPMIPYHDHSTESVRAGLIAETMAPMMPPSTRKFWPKRLRATCPFMLFSLQPSGPLP